MSLRAFFSERLPFRDLHLLSLVAVVIWMAVAESFERDSSVHVGFLIHEENVVFATRAVVVYHHTPADVSRLQASSSFNVDGRRLCWVPLSRFLSYKRNWSCKQEPNHEKYSDLHVRTPPG